MSQLTGFADVDRQLAKLGNPTTIKKVAKQGLTASQRVLVKGIKATIPSRYKEARRTVGNSFKRLKHGETAGQVSAKVGFGVGKKMPSREEAEGTRRSRRAHKKSGVGISARNIHWLVLGTRSTHSKPLLGKLEQGINAAKAESEAKLRSNITAGIERELGKRLKK